MINARYATSTSVADAPKVKEGFAAMTPKKLSAERLTKIRRAIRQLTAWTTPEGGYESAAVDLLAHCDALAAENQALREVAKFYRVGHDGGEIARAALEKTS